MRSMIQMEARCSPENRKVHSQGCTKGGGSSFADGVKRNVKAEYDSDRRLA